MTVQYTPQMVDFGSMANAIGKPQQQPQNPEDPNQPAPPLFEAQQQPSWWDALTGSLPGGNANYINAMLGGSGGWQGVP